MMSHTKFPSLAPFPVHYIAYLAERVLIPKSLLEVISSTSSCDPS